MRDDQEPAARPKIKAGGDIETAQAVGISGGWVDNVVGRLTNVHHHRDQAALAVAVLALVLVASVGGMVAGWATATARSVTPPGSSGNAAAQTAPPIGVTGVISCVPPEAADAGPAPPADASPYPDEVRLALSFEGRAGLRVLDASRHGAHGWLVGSFGARDEGHDGDGLYLDGASLVCVPDHQALRIRRELEISVWVRPAVIDDRTRNIVAKFARNGPSSYRLYLRNGYPTFWLGDPNGGVAVESPFQLEAERWHHLVARFDGARLSISVDGQEKPMEHQGTIPVSSVWLEIGSTPYRNEFFIGDIDELVIRGR